VKRPVGPWGRRNVRGGVRSSGAERGGGQANGASGDWGRHSLQSSTKPNGGPTGNQYLRSRKVRDGVGGTKKAKFDSLQSGKLKNS